MEKQNEFKGTKGKWKAVWNGHYYDIKTSIDGYCHNLCNTISNVFLAIGNQEEKANALLISKAPEMLQMLESFVNDFDNGLIDDFQIPRDRFEQLIKEATEI